MQTRNLYPKIILIICACALILEIAILLLYFLYPVILKQYAAELFLIAKDLTLFGMFVIFGAPIAIGAGCISLLRKNKKNNEEEDVIYKSVNSRTKIGDTEDITDDEEEEDPIHTGEDFDEYGEDLLMLTKVNPEVPDRNVYLVKTSDGDVILFDTEDDEEYIPGTFLHFHSKDCDCDECK
jgi:hypothetical protein